MWEPSSEQELESVVSRFWSKVSFADFDECWEWQGAISSTGYGQFTVGHTRANHGQYNAHKFCYYLIHGIWLPRNLVIMHICDNRACVNPLHLVAGTQKENMLDALDKGRNKQTKLNKSNRELMLELFSIGVGCTTIARLFDVDKSTALKVKWNHGNNTDWEPSASMPQMWG